MQCYCNSTLDYYNCCEPLHKGTYKAETAEQLMRSRYSAYALADINYLLNSHHKSSRPTRDRKNILKWAKSVSWMGLEIIAMQKGTTRDSVGYVEFKAFYESNGKLECIHEKSYFVRENDMWYYKSGE